MYENKVYGVIALVLAILSIVLSFSMIFSFIIGIIAIILGILSLKTVRKNMGVASIIIGTFGIIFSIIISIVVIFFIYGVELLADDKIVINKQVEETLTLSNISINYDNSWKLDEINTTEQKKVIKKGNSKIVMVVTSGKIFYTTEQFTKKIQQEYEEMYNDVKIGEEQIINNNTWITIEYSYDKNNKKYQSIQYFLIDDYDQYSVSYVTYDTEYLDMLNEAIDIINTVKLDTTQKKLDEEEAKKELVGEWDCGKTGYFVFNEDGTYYFYKDSSKSMDNVIIGKYSATNKIKTYASGYTEGIYILCDIEKGIMNKETYIKPNNKIDYAFIPSEEGKYKCKNLVNYSTFEAIKVK